MTTVSTIIRPTIKADRAAILALVEQTGFFRPDEVLVAQDVLDDALKAGPNNMYASFTATLDGTPVGWICIGPTLCTLGTFDIYWIAVSGARHRKGIGRQLLEHAEESIRKAGGRLVVIETSNREQYKPTRAFYLRNGYVEEACLKDFYAPGDDKVIYLKRL